MNKNLEQIALFIKKHHVLTLASRSENSVDACSLFYAYEEENLNFVVASSAETQHIQNIKEYSDVAGNILLETKEIGRIQGLQFKGNFHELEDGDLRKLYFKSFPYALAMKPKLWKINVTYFKLTDNRLGFGKKLIWPEPSL